MSHRHQYRSTAQSGSDGETSVPAHRHSNKTGVASLESDSHTEAGAARRDRRKKRTVRRSKSTQMDVDPQLPSSSKSKIDRHMEVDGFESHISSSDSERGASPEIEADDEQSDWVGYSPSDTEFDPSDPRARRDNGKVAEMSQLQKKLERFALSGDKGEMGIEFKIKDRPNSVKFNKMLLKYRLEVVKRQRGNVVLRRRNNRRMVKPTPIAAEFARLTVRVEIDDDRFAERDFDLLVSEAVTSVLGSCGPDFKVDSFDKALKKGSIVSSGADIQNIWAALSTKGRFFSRRVAIHFFALTECQP